MATPAEIEAVLGRPPTPEEIRLLARVPPNQVAKVAAQLQGPFGNQASGEAARTAPRPPPPPPQPTATPASGGLTAGIGTAPPVTPSSLAPIATVITPEGNRQEIDTGLTTGDTSGRARSEDAPRNVAFRVDPETGERLPQNLQPVFDAESGEIVVVDIENPLVQEDILRGQKGGQSTFSVSDPKKQEKKRAEIAGNIKEGINNLNPFAPPKIDFETPDITPQPPNQVLGQPQATGLPSIGIQTNVGGTVSPAGQAPPAAGVPPNQFGTPPPITTSQLEGSEQVQPDGSVLRVQEFDRFQPTQDSALAAAREESDRVRRERLGQTRESFDAIRTAIQGQQRTDANAFAPGGAFAAGPVTGAPGGGAIITNQQAAAAQQVPNVARAQQQGLGNTLLAQARGEGVTAAQALQQQGLEDAIRQQIALSTAQTGVSSGAALRQANEAGISLSRRAIADATALRAREQQAAQQQAAQLLTAGRGQDIEQAKLATQTALQQRAQQLQELGITTQAATDRMALELKDRLGQQGFAVDLEKLRVATELAVAGMDMELALAEAGFDAQNRGAILQLSGLFISSVLPRGDSN